jgi:hypothetical protein
MPKQDLSTCPATQHQFVITNWEVKTSERRIARNDDTVEAETTTSQRAITLVCSRCAKVQAAPPK